MIGRDERTFGRHRANVPIGGEGALVIEELPPLGLNRSHLQLHGAKTMVQDKKVRTNI